MRVSILILIPVLFLLFGCSQKNEDHPQLTPAFYYWKTTFRLSDGEQKLLKETGASPLYIRFFDIDWKPGVGAVPVAQLELDSTASIGVPIVPVVFITNRTMINIRTGDIDTLAGKILKKIDYIAQGFPDEIREIQLDCDWSEKSREHYFALIKKLQKRVENRGVTVTSTLRLHQYRYPRQTGIPPVPKVMLMFYNMGNVSDMAETNSILNLAKAAPYIEDATPYPIPLDIAVPVFGWGVLFRGGKTIDLLKGLREKDLQDSLRFHKIRENHFEVIKSTYLDGVYLYEGDLIRLESTSEKLLLECVPLLRKAINQPNTRIAFYHLDSSIQKDFSNEFICRFFDEISK